MTMRSPSMELTRPFIVACTRPGSGEFTTVQPVGAVSTASCSCSTSRPRSSTPTRVAICSTSASRWLDRKTVVPAAVQLQQQLADLRDALRVQAVRRLVQDQQLRTAEQRAGQPEPLPHAQRVGPDRSLADTGQADLLEDLVDPVPPGAPRRRRDRTRPATPGSPGRTGARSAAGPSISAPTRGSTCRPARGIRSPSTSTSPLVASTRPSSIRTVVVLPEPFAPRKP